MNANQNESECANPARLPRWLKLAYTAFMAVLVPVYLTNYGPTNFLYFCDVALLLTLVAVWRENALLASVAAVGILLPQLLWVVDFGAHVAGLKLTGLTDYMFDPTRSLFLRGLSLFHGWLPFMLAFLVFKLGYDRRALPVWSVLTWVLILVCFFFLPKPGEVLSNPHAPVNINYVRGMSETVAQSWMPEWAWLALMLLGMPVLIFVPTHLTLRKLCPRAA